MTYPTAANEQFSPAPLLGLMLLAPAAGALIGMAISSLAGWSNEASSWNRTQACSAAAACWLMGGLLGIVVMAAISNMAIHRLPVAVIVSSMVRAGVALTDGLVITFMFKPEIRTFWTAFLGAGVLCLVAETWWSMGAIKAAAARVTGAGIGKSGSTVTSAGGSNPG
jgi:hypothetical protein